jgi:5-(aminomethyl)-3-furanmethanol phosphate kinase
MRAGGRGRDTGRACAPVNGAAPAPWIVVKLGGSLAGDPSLAHWLHELALNGSTKFVVVPGGGPFADAVRAAQGRWGFSDEVAHAMAIGAMDQFGRMLCGIEVGSIPCSTLQQIEHARASGRLPVWLPGYLMTGEQRLPRNWDVTSDTIAAWLADALGAVGLLLVKSCDLPVDSGDAVALAAAGIVDPALPVFLSGRKLALQVVQKDNWSDVKDRVTRMRRRV